MGRFQRGQGRLLDSMKRQKLPRIEEIRLELGEKLAKQTETKLKFAELRRQQPSFKVDPALLSSALPPGSTAPELKARIHSLPETH